VPGWGHRVCGGPKVVDKMMRDSLWPGVLSSIVRQRIEYMMTTLAGVVSEMDSTH